MNHIYRIHIGLRHMQPPIWRRIEVTADTDLGDLHEIIQITMGWEDEHLHAFRIGKRLYGDPAALPEAEQDEFDVTLADLVGEGDTFLYDYDFGDGWEHELKIEQVLASEAGARYPRCLAGEGACPPEDCGGPPGYANLLAALADPAHEAHDDTLDWLGEAFDPADFNIEFVNEMLGLDIEDFMPGSPVYEADELAAMSEAALFDNLAEHGDRVPRNLIDECARRGDAMLDTLESYLASYRDQEGDVEFEAWWLPLHAVMILGLIPGERAGQLLLSYLRTIAAAKEMDIQNWLAGFWPALMRNKPDTVIDTVRSACFDKQLDWYPRINLIEVVLAAAQSKSEAFLEQALDWAAQIAADESEHWTLRLLVAQYLINLPRERHRPLLKKLADRQPFIGRHFDRESIESSYMQNIDEPEWERFSNPWRFYDPEAIEQRQRRWLEEALEEFEDEEELLGDNSVYPFLPDNEEGASQPWQRQSPKIGRNDPCPCGSGKKYKKCCLSRTLH